MRYLVLTDIHGGSCAQAALSGAVAGHGAPVITGVNLPMLVDFLVNRGSYSAASRRKSFASRQFPY